MARLTILTVKELQTLYGLPQFTDAGKLPAMAISKPIRLAQQAEILQLFDYQICSQDWKQKLQEKASELVTIYTKPVYVFKELVNFLEYHRVVIPGYTYLQEEVVGKAMTNEQKRLEKIIVEGVVQTLLSQKATLWKNERFFKIRVLNVGHVS